MKLRSFLAFSLLCNLALAVIFFKARPDSIANPATPPSTSVTTILKTASSLLTTSEAPVPVVIWRQVASADYRQYIANLRTVECPEWLIRDIIVADIDDLYRQKTRTDPVYIAPWQGAEQRRKMSRDRSAKLNVLRQEKRALVKSLLGYEWDNHADEIWNLDFLTTLTFGFLPDDKVSQVLARKNEYSEAVQNVQADANYILISGDRTRLLSLYEELEVGLSGLLAPMEFDELQLRAQQDFLITHDIHFDGVTISHAELREIVRMSKSFKDMARTEFVPERPLSEIEQVRWKAAFEAQVKNLLGPGRFADYQRAQDFNFREIFEFSRQNQLPQTAAISVYEARRNAEVQAEEIQKDGSLSADERATALGVLKAATMATISAALGGNCQNYLDGPGQWLGTLAQPPQTQ